MNRCALTIDVDMEPEVEKGSEENDIFKKQFGIIKEILRQYPKIKTTWFIRMDSDIRERYGQADYIFRKYRAELDWLKLNGHILGWHVHVYENETGRREYREKEIICELNRNIGIAAQWGIHRYFRMGDSVMSNTIMNFLEKNGVKYECSGLPRPCYPWIDSRIDWSRAPQHTYIPSKADYQIPQQESRGIIEVPMTTVPLSASYDSRIDMLRYINPLYEEFTFARVIGTLRSDCVIIMHPHEIVEGGKHELLTYSPETLRNNLELLMKKYICTSIEELTESIVKRGKINEKSPCSSGRRMADTIGS